jgi:hypothetical protein
MGSQKIERASSPPSLVESVRIRETAYRSTGGARTHSGVILHGERVC